MIMRHTPAGAAVALVLVAAGLLPGCRKPAPQPPGGAVPEPAAAEEFGSAEWDDLTGALLSAGRAGMVDEFKARLSPVTIRVFEAAWVRLLAKIDMAQDLPALSAQDRTALENLERGCSWEGMSKGYKPGRLVAVNPMEGGRYQVTEISPRNSRKLEYAVERIDGVWVILYEEDNRWVKDLEAFLTSVIDKIILRSGGIPEQASPAPQASEADAA